MAASFFDIPNPFNAADELSAVKERMLAMAPASMHGMIEDKFARLGPQLLMLTQQAVNDKHSKILDAIAAELRAAGVPVA